MVTAAAAAQSGNFIYTDNGTDITITGYAVGAPPVVVIPATIVVSQDPLVERPVVSIGTGIGPGPFEGRTELTSVTIPSGVTSIGTKAFLDCIGVTSITLPSGLLSIGTYSFSNCRALSSIAIPPSVTSIGRNAFAHCVALTGMSLPAGVTSIGTETFLRCGALSNITIPVTVTSIGFGAFSYCSALTSVVIPSGVTSIAGSTFYSCSGMTSVTLPSAITSIGTFAFQYCSALTTVTIPNVISLPNKVFANCRSLTTVAIPATVTTIHAAAFAECSSLTSFTVAAGNPNFNSLNGLLTNLEQTKLITCPGGVSGNFTIPTGLTDIDTQAFRLCGELTGVTFHSGVLSIGIQAFSTCGKLKYAVFMGNPPLMGSGVFETPAPGVFTIYYLNNLTWPITPESTWFGYHAVYIEAITPVFNWLLAKGLPGNSNLQSDMNGDGINLLMAYALNLEPNAFNSPPQPVLGGNQMSLSFYADTPGVTYVVRASDDMQNWSAEGVSLSGPATNRTATVGISGPKRFMRLEVSY